MFESKNKNGFTLIELLVVMSIVAVLAGLAIGGYTAFRKMALVDLNADLIVSQLNEMRDKAIHGTGAAGEGDKVLQCYGLKLEKNTEEDAYAVTAFTQDFSGKKSWNALAMNWKDSGCEGVETPVQNFQIDSMVLVEKISRTNDISLPKDYVGETLEMRFVPPDGLIEVKTDKPDFEHISELGDNKILIKVRYGAGEDDLYARNILIDLGSGKISKI